jgi:GH43 family beta-xylosidase
MVEDINNSNDRNDAKDIWTNPLVPNRADPWVLKEGDDYYFIASVPEFNRIELRKASSLAALSTADAMTVWTEHENGPMKHHVWAPEIHKIDGKWYIYFAAAHSEDVWRIRMYVLECEESSPMTTHWTEKGQIKTLWDSFSLDATTFELGGKRYMVWAQQGQEKDNNSNIYIDELVNPWTLAGKQTLITRPELEWEVIGYKVNEGPATIITQDKVFLTYSASKTDFNYCLGLLELDAHKDPLCASNWTKSKEPVFVSSEENGQFGPGHNSFVATKDPNKYMLVYHARNYKEIEGDPLHDPNRHARAQFITLENGKLVFGVPVKDGIYCG